MPLVPATLQAQLERLHDEMLQIKDPAQAKAYHAQQLAIIITNYIKTGLVTVTTAAGPATGTIT